MTRFKKKQSDILEDSSNEDSPCQEETTYLEELKDICEDEEDETENGNFKTY